MPSAKQIKQQKAFAKKYAKKGKKKTGAKSNKVQKAYEDLKSKGLTAKPKKLSKAFERKYKPKMKLPNGQGVFLVSDMPNPKAFRKKYLVVGIKRIGSRESWLIPKKQFDDFKEARKYEQKLDYGYSVHDDPTYSDRPIDQEAVAEFLHGTKDDFI